MAFWGERERGSVHVVGVYVSSPVRGCVASDVPLSAAVSRAESWALIRVSSYYDPAARLPWFCDMVTESTISWIHQLLSCYVVPIINN